MGRCETCGHSLRDDHTCPRCGGKLDVRWVWMAVILLAIALTGCVSGEVVIKSKGQECTAKYISVYKDFTQAQMQLCGSTIGSDKSQSKDKAVAALLNALQ